MKAQVDAILHPFERIVRLDEHGRIKQESDVFKQVKSRHGFSFAGCLRADLADVLLGALKDTHSMHFDHEMIGISQSNTAVRLDFKGRDSMDFDFVIGADGIHSQVFLMSHVE